MLRASLWSVEVDNPKNLQQRGWRRYEFSRLDYLGGLALQEAAAIRKIWFFLHSLRAVKKTSSQCFWTAQLLTFSSEAAL